MKQLAGYIASLTLAVSVAAAEPAAMPRLVADAQGKLTLLGSSASMDHGIVLETIDDHLSLGRWEDPQGTITWDAEFTRPGKLKVSATVAAMSPSEFVLRIGNAQLPGHAPATGQWNNFQSIDLGIINLRAAGRIQIQLQAKDAATWKPINVRAITFSPVDTGSEPANASRESSLKPDAQGKLTLPANAAKIDHDIILEMIDGQANLGAWFSPKASATWNAEFTRPGKYQVSATVATQSPSDFVLQIGNAQLPAHVPATGQWENFQSINLGTIELRAAGKSQIKLQARDAATWNPINLRSVTFSPVGTR